VLSVDQSDAGPFQVRNIFLAKRILFYGLKASVFVSRAQELWRNCAKPHRQRQYAAMRAHFASGIIAANL
jgi:hypothetical protein